MRLRQVAFMAHKVAPIAEQLDTVFGLKVGFRDPGVGYFGLANVVMPVGGEFLEVLEPIREDASGARYLARRGGDAGYMVILQDADALAHRARLQKMGVRLIATSRGDDLPVHPLPPRRLRRGAAVHRLGGGRRAPGASRRATGRRPGRVARARERRGPRHQRRHHPVARSLGRLRTLVPSCWIARRPPAARRWRSLSSAA